MKTLALVWLGLVAASASTERRTNNECHKPIRRFGAPGMNHNYYPGWDTGHRMYNPDGTRNHDHDHDHDHGHGHGHGHGSDTDEYGHPHSDHHGEHNGEPPNNGEECADTSVDGTVQEIINNPTVPVNEPIPVVADNTTVPDLVDSGVVPTTNITDPVLDDGMMPALMNSSTGGDAIGFGGITSMMVRRSPLAAQREALDARKRQLTVNAQPAPPAQKSETEEPDPDKRCAYERTEHVLGGDGSPSKGSLWALEGYVDLVAADVQQGGIGDCGLGASVMALAAGGWTRYLKNSFTRVGTGEGSYEVLLKRDGVTQRIAIDDQLPVRTAGSASNCWPYPGYQPVEDAVVDATDPRGYKKTPIFFMPLLEKAFAKFLDANPDWKSTPPEVMGYLGLEGINPSFALAALTGGTPKPVYRTRAGFDPFILGAVLTCMIGDAPCVIGTTNATTLEGLGMKDTTQTIWLNPDRSEGYAPGNTAGMTASDSPKSNSTYTVIDFDQVVVVDGRDRSTALTLVGTHAYAFDHSASTDWPLQNSVSAWNEARINIVNPWGSNPCSWPGGGCGKDGGIYPQAARLPLSLRTFVQTIYSVYTVENMPPA
ncbi:hypothetical protein CC85DRAFT_328169 [Cutaneotrichosporon oleaginosum]|uniref:Calpain catalytic domain-containing protein n=1 Tax=Cutaneotrichosporon oleaginosum TaxID=879819 RepID=A0A0J1B456_9TREE|nr:uncharacterized protein CC85DRAFT_328169 [Cutaneotrichosporon oleaginosum]KLT42414.1 hypothetical protein CC85DRAFT_328169 [Cutaneotrichosporon oleaginosum]TXT06933.1 hypothetical protein COLE_06264 [Cutaneotrichosporon oleaginosum]